MRSTNVALLQGMYDLVTGLWPLISMRTFVAFTGPKRDLWLVRTLGLLIGLIGLVLTLGARRGRVSPEIRLLAVGSALSLGSIDVTYALRGRISHVYLGDALAQFTFVALWIFSATRREQRQYT